MKTVSASAPGKLVLTGEYAVLHGGAAIAIAAGRRAGAKITTGVDAAELIIVNDDQRFGFVFENNELTWEQQPGVQGRLLEAASRVLADANLSAASLGPMTVELCSQEFYVDDAIKLGLGSSAAVGVALTACLQQLLTNEHDLDAALAVHRAFQRGQGSGIDVCTSYHGGVIATHNGNVWQLTLPTDLQMVPVWTGVPASTPAKLQLLTAFGEAEPAEHAALLAALSAQSVAALHACESGDTIGLLAALESFACGLEDLDEAVGLGIWSAEHRVLAQLAGDAGLVYKPSGAGGGDFGLAFGTSEAAAQAFSQAAASAGYRCGDFDLGVAGLRLN